MEKQLTLLEKNAEEFGAFVSEFKNLVTRCVENNAHMETDEFGEAIASLVVDASGFGIQYGLNHKFKRCDSKYVKSTVNYVNIIDLDLSFRHLIKALMLVYKHVIECKKIFICSDNLLVKPNLNLHSIYFSKRWIPGTLTNTKYTWPKYQFDTQALNKPRPSIHRQAIPVSLVFSMLPNLYPVLSREVVITLTREIIFDTSKHKSKHSNITYIGIVDTHIKTVEHTNIVNVCLNSYSRYTRILVGQLMQHLFEIVKK